MRRIESIDKLSHVIGYEGCKPISIRLVTLNINICWKSFERYSMIRGMLIKLNNIYNVTAEEVWDEYGCQRYYSFMR